MKVKVFFPKKRMGVVIITPVFKNSFLLQNYLNDRFGLTGWHGFEIL